MTKTNRSMKDSGIEWIGKIPEDWSLERLQWCMDEVNIKNQPIQTTQVLSLTNKLGVVPYEEKGNQGNKAKEDISEYKLAYTGSLIVNSMNVIIGSVGISNYTGCVSPVYYVFNANEKADLRFINYIFSTIPFQKELRKYAKGILEIRLRVSSGDIFKRPIALPIKQEQQKIADFLDEKCSHIDSVLDKTKASIEEYKKLKQAVITQAVTKGIRPNRPMKDSGIEWIGEIPEDWRIKRLRYIGNCQNGISKGAEAFGSGYPFISYSNVYRNIVLPEIATEFIETTKEERELYSVQVGDVFFTRTSETIEEIGFSSVCEKTIPNATFAGFLIRFRPYNKKEIIPKYSKYYFRANIHRAFFVKEMNLVTRASLGQGLLKRLPVILPNIQEQEEIADYLDIKCAEIDKLMEKKVQLISELETYKKSLIYEYVTGKKEVC